MAGQSTRAIATGEVARNRDLDWMRESFEAIDHIWFADGLEALGVTVHWQRWRQNKETYRLGSYDAELRRIEVHRALAHEWIPMNVALLVIYHEALHALLGPEHDSRFRAHEQAFPGYAEALHWEMEHWERVLRAPRPVLR